MAKPYPSLSTSADVIKAAEAFLKAIGQGVIGTPTATFPDPTLVPDEFHPYWRKTWEVSYPGLVDIGVIDGSNRISSVFEWAGDHTSAPADKAEAQSLALQKFQQVLTASGIDRGELGAASVREKQIGYPATQSGCYWDVSAPRQFHSVPYEDQKAEAYIQAKTGRIQIFTIRFSSPAPLSDVRRIDESQARKIAADVLSRSDVSVASFESSSLGVVQPYTPIQKGGSEKPILGEACVAWICSFTGTGKQRGTYYELWISSQDGHLLGDKVMVLD
jgi:hypothetical protein